MAGLSTFNYRGARDYYPEDKRVQNYIFDTWRKTVERFGYEAYGAPLLESLDVYIAKSGQELVGEQTYSFTERGNKAVAIRPEMTPGIARMVAARRQELGYPARLYSIANFMRYERPQHGREREFWQLNADIFGVDNLLAEFEIIRLAYELMSTFGARTEDYRIRINDRRLIGFIMATYLGLEAKEGNALSKLLDRKDNMSDQQFAEQADQIFDDAHSTDGYSKLRSLLDAKTMADLPDSIVQSDAVHEIQQLFSLLASHGINNARFDITLQRGLDYYTGTVFEVFDTDPQNGRSLFGGGRYDGLVGLFGVAPLGAVGLAVGATTMEDFLRTHELLPELAPSTRLAVVSIGESLKGALELADRFREHDVNVEVDITGRKSDSQLKSVTKKGVPFALIVGERELASGEYTLKNMGTGEEERLSFDALVMRLKPSH